MHPITEALSRVELGSPVQFLNLTFFPLLVADDAMPSYTMLDEVLALKTARVTEVSESGSVPELLFVNDGDIPVLLVDGEELVGARQNRILTLTVLVGGKKQVVIPVSCVEQGRWSWKSRHFESSNRNLFAKARAKKMRHVSESMRAGGTRSASQAEIWNDISDKAQRLSTRSSTEAMSDIFEQQDSRIEEYVKAFRPLERQGGALFAVNGEIAGMELFDAPATFRKFLDKLLRSYAMDALDAPALDSKPPTGQEARRFLDEMMSVAAERFPAIGEGEDLRIENRTIAGGALLFAERVVHLCAFRVGSDRRDPLPSDAFVLS